MESQKFDIVQVTRENIDTEHICCAIGNDKTNRARSEVKKNWLKERFPEGHVFKKIDVRGKVFIEYVPAEYAWYPIIAPGYTFIQCFWASGRYKGQGLGKKLLQACEKDARGSNGIVAITSPKKMGFIVDRKFYIKQGFEDCDFADPYFQLVVKPFKKAPMPKFTDRAKGGVDPGRKGFTFYYSDLCPFNSDYVDIMIDQVKKHNMPYQKIKITTLKQAKDSPAPMGHFSVFYNDKLLSHEVMVEKKFNELVAQLKQKKTI